MIDIGTRKHGPFDSRYPRPSARADSSTVVASEECDRSTPGRGRADRSTLIRAEPVAGTVSAVPSRPRFQRG